MKGVLRARSRFALGASIDYDNYRSYRHVKTYRGRLFNRDQPTCDFAILIWPTCAHHIWPTFTR
jgi:hypothetical protein